MAGVVWEPRAGSEVKLTAMADEDALAREVDAYGYTGAVPQPRIQPPGRAQRAHAAGRTGAWRCAAPSARSRRQTRFRFGVLDRERTDRGATARVDADVSLAGGGRVSFGAEGAWMDNAQAGTVPSTDRLAPGSPAMAMDAAAKTRGTWAATWRRSARSRLAAR